MPKVIPYIILILISVVLFVIAWRKASDKKMLIFYLCLAGLVYYFEFIVLVVFKSYEYMPEIFKARYFDNIFGANVSDGFIVPVTAVIIAVFNLGIRWIVLMVLCFVGIEEIFLALKVYKHFWWNTIFTAIGLFIHFNLGKWIWGLVRNHTNRAIVRFGALYFANCTIQATFLYYISAIFHVVFYRVNWFENDPTRGHIAFQAIFAFVDSLFFAAAVTARARWFWQLLLVLCGVGFNIMLHVRGVLEIPGNWVFALIAAGQAGYLFILKYFRQILQEG